MLLGNGAMEERKAAEKAAREAEEAAAARARDTVVEIDGTIKVQGEVSERMPAAVPGPVPTGARDKEDLAQELQEFSAKMPRDDHEKRAAKELYDEMSDDYHRFIKEKVAALPIVRYQRRAPFTEDEKRIIAAGLMSRTPHYKIAQVLRCSYAKIDKAILDDEFLTELAREAIIREKEEVEEGIDDCVRARNPAVIMWKAAKLMPEKYGDQVNLDTEDDTRLVIGAIPEDVVSEGDQIVEEMRDKVPVVPTPALIAANEIQAERAAAGEGVSYVSLAQTPATPAIKPPPGDPRFRPLVPAGEQNQVDENGNVVSRGVSAPGDDAEEGEGDDSMGYGDFMDDLVGGGDSWI